MNDPAQYEGWARARGAVPGGSQTVRLVLRGRSETPVVITRVRVVPRQRAPALAGWYVEDAVGGEVPVREMRADVDCPDASALLYDVVLAPPAREPTDVGSIVDVPNSTREALAMRDQLLAQAREHLMIAKEELQPVGGLTEAETSAAPRTYLRSRVKPTRSRGRSGRPATCCETKAWTPSADQ